MNYEEGIYHEDDAPLDWLSFTYSWNYVNERGECESERGRGSKMWKPRNYY